MQTTDQLLNEAMLMLAEQANVIFLGQNVAFDGNVVYKHLEGVPPALRLELPVAEEMQMGMSIGLSLQGYLPISIYPRFDFLLRAADQLVNHLDKLAVLSQGQWQPKVIIRTRVGSRKPLDAGPQHTQDHSKAFHSMLKHVAVSRIDRPQSILTVYRNALERKGSTLIVEAL